MNISRYAQSVGKLLFDVNYSEAITNSINASKALNKARGLNAYHSIFKNIGDSFVSAEKATKGTSVWKGFKTSVKTFVPDLKAAFKSASGFKGKAGAIFGQLGKRMPLIGGAIMVLTELPNICSAFKDKGLVGGLLETGKSTARLCGSMAGFAIGQALIPIPLLGGLIGGIAGDWLVSKVVGKSHSEKKAEAEEKLAEAQIQENNAQQVLQQTAPNNQALAQNNIAQNYQMPAMTPQQLMQMQQMLYGNGTNAMNDDFMVQASGLNKLNLVG